MEYAKMCQGLKNAEGGDLVISGVSVLDADLRKRLEASAERMGLEALATLQEDGVIALSLQCEGESAIDQIAIVREGESTAEILLVDDGISYEQLSPYQLVEYAFATGSGEYMVCNIGVETLDAYKANKFGIWKDNMLNAFGGCAAAFLPELRRGHALSTVYDHMIFTSPEDEKASWETEHNGKMVSIPRPVHSLRVWDSATHGYIAVNPRMPGAPDNTITEERESYWEDFLQQLKDTLNPKYGDHFVQDCLTMAVDEVKAKYGF